MDWVLILGVVGLIWAIVVLTWRRGEENERGEPPGAMVQATARARPPAAPKIYGYGEDDPLSGAQSLAALRPDGRLAGAGRSPEAGFGPQGLHRAGRAAVAQPKGADLQGIGLQGAELRADTGSATPLNGAARPPRGAAPPAQTAPPPLPQAAATPANGSAAPRATAHSTGATAAAPAERLPVRISDYQPGEQVVIQYVPTHPGAPMPYLSAHQVGADVEIRLSGTTVAILECQRAGELIERELLHLAREEPETLTL